jgi:hypothetical protein
MAIPTPWSVGRVEFYGAGPLDGLRPGRQAELLAFLASLDLDPALLVPVCVFTCDRDRYQVHFAEHLLVDGERFVDQVHDRIATRPVVVDITREQLPSWLRPPE